jgi:hypothetical protein
MITVLRNVRVSSRFTGAVALRFIASRSPAIAAVSTLLFFRGDVATLGPVVFDSPPFPSVDPHHPVALSYRLRALAKVGIYRYSVACP